MEWRPLTFVLFVDLDVDRVDALLDVVPREELLALAQGVGPQADQSVCISVNHLQVSREKKSG